jgi:hypothetical protein
VFYTDSEERHEKKLEEFTVWNLDGCLAFGWRQHRVRWMGKQRR